MEEATSAPLGDATVAPPSAEPPRRHGRVVSAACFRVLSLQLETQNEVDVLKPILEELEVLRLSCVLGALPSVNPKDFEFEMLEAKEFDDEFARFLRSDVFGGDGHARGPSVRVSGLFGKQAQVTSQLKRLGGWDDAMDTKLRGDDLGLYAVVLPEGAQADGAKIVVMFPWLLDDYFHADRLRETPAYLLRLLTCVTSHVTCCFSRDDKRLMEEFNLRDDAVDNGSDDEWRSYSAAFHVEQQQDAKDDVSSVELQALPLPKLCKDAFRVDVVKGHFPALLAVAKSPPTKAMKPSKRIDFSTPADFCDWLLERSNHFDLRIASDKLSDELVEELLKRCDEWPQDELDEVKKTLASNKYHETASVQARITEKVDGSLRELQAAGEELFQLDAVLNEARTESLAAMVKARVQELQAGSGVARLPLDTVKTLHLPARLPKMIRVFQELYENDHEELLNMELQRAPVTLAKDMISSPPRLSFSGVWRSFKSVVVGESTEVSDAFRERMREPLQSMKQVWFAAFASAYEAHGKARAASLLEYRLLDVDNNFLREYEATVDRAFRKLVATWSESTMNGLGLRLMVQHRTGRGINCSYEEETHLPSRDQVFLWSFKAPLSSSSRGPSNRELVRLGIVDLDDGEELLGVFAIQNRSALFVVVVHGHTVVRRVEFHEGRNQIRSSVQRVREVARPSVLCDYYDKERLLVLVDASGKAGVYRLDEKFKSMETIRTVNLALTSLAMPIKGLVLSDGILYMVDHEGAMQSLNTRNQQTSRKNQVGFPRCRDGSKEDKTRLVRVADGSVLGWIEVEEDVTNIKFVAAEDMRELPQSMAARLPASKRGLVYEVVDDVLVVVDPARGTLQAIELTASLKSESYRIRSTNGMRVGDTVIHAANANDQDSRMLSQHWLWTLYHLYEKFPVRGELFRGATGFARRNLELSFVCDEEQAEDSTDFEDGCQKLLGFIMEKLQLLNKPLYGLDLAGTQVVIRGGPASQTTMMDEYGRITPLAVAALLRELVTFVPVQICRAEFNSLTLMTDGQSKPQEDTGTQGDTSSLSSADIALKLRFGLLSPLLSSWSRQCIVVTSMGKQSTGKSYFLNHLTGSSFAISGARCTDGAWMSVRFLPNGAMLVVIDFEGLGSFERTEQEDVFLSVLNASVSMLTIFRMEMRLDKEIDELFSKFQKGSQLIKNDPQLFRGKLYMSVKDVNPNDQRNVVGEFVTKFQRLLEANKEQNFLTDMYAGQLDINCSPPLGTVGYYRSLSHAQRFIDKQLCGNPKAGFPSGKAFLDCIRLLLAKVSILDWTSLDESTLRMKVAEVMKKLPGVLRFGSVCDGYGEDTAKTASLQSLSREKLAVAATGEPIKATFDEVCALNPILASKWRLLAARIPIDQVEDDTIDLGPSVSLVAPNRTEAASTAIQNLFKTFAELVGPPPKGQPVTTKRLQQDFDSFLSFVVRRRCARVHKWCQSVFGDRVPDAWASTERQALSAIQTLFVRCLDACSSCQLGCMKVSTHVAGGDHTHDCDTSHVCIGACTYCVDAFAEDGEMLPPLCSKPAGHEGRCECDKGDHTCARPCILSHAINCGHQCSKKAGHDESEDHRCAVGLHKCGQPCAALNCTRQCVMDVEVPHTAHKCEVDRCMSQCIMEGCTRSCSSTDHFHGHTEAKIAFDVENPDLAAKHGGTFDASAEKPTIHMCDEAHACPDMCAQDGICHIDVILKKSSKTFVGARGSFQYTFQEMNGSRKKCARQLEPGQMAHSGAHSCVASHHGASDKNQDTKRSAAASAAGGDQVIHYCDVRCPCCSYYCQRAYGHEGLHKTTHGNMRNTMFISDENEIDLVDRKYAAGERGTAEMCNLYCSKMGRGHVHFLDCEKEHASDPCVYQGSREDMRRHCELALEPTPEKEQDEVLHERFWDTLGWEDPCSSIQEREEFAKCSFKCDAPDHDGKEVSHCVLPAWHPPVAQPAEGADGFSYVGGHKFECSHVTSGGLIHHVFVLDASGSMQGDPWQRLNGAFREYVNNRIQDGSTLDLVTVITFDGKAEIVWEAEPITSMAQVEAPFLGGGTSFSAGLRATNEVLSRMAFETYKPVVVFFSDGHPAEGHEGDALANHIAESYAKYGLEAFAVGFGYINLTILHRIADRLGGTYCHVLTGGELKKTFTSISASLGTRAGLVLTKPFHEMICVICQKELASEATAVLTPCQHELHQRCLRSLMENTGEDEAKLCPTCRREFQPVVV